MSQLYTQRQIVPDAWDMSGAPASTVICLSVDALINYSDGSADTLPANTPAVLPDATTSFDRTHDVYVPYTVQGSGVLSIIKESLLPTLTDDYAPLARVELHGIKPYQPQAYLASGGLGTAPPTTVVALTSTTLARAYSLWTGSANAAPPANWQTPGFDDSAWGAAVAAAYGGPYPSTAGVTPIWATLHPASVTQRCLLRQHFSLASGVPTAATLVIEADDILLAVYVNGTAIPCSSAIDVWPQTLSVPLSALNPGGDNVLATEGANADPAGLGNASVDYQLSVTFAGTAGAGTVSSSGSGGTPALSDPTTAPGDLLVRANTATSTLVVGFIGDSLTQGTVGGGATPTPTIAGADLAGATGRTVTVSNQGISGTTSADWLPRTGNYLAAVAAFASAGATIVHVVLGTNDAKNASMVSVATYRSHMSLIAQALAAAGYTVVLSYQPYITPGALGQWDAVSDTQLLGYQGALRGLANGSTIRLGDTTAYSYFQAHQSELADGVHPDATGKTSLGQLWANGLLSVVTSLQRLTVGSGLAIGGGVLRAGGSSGAGGRVYAHGHFL